MKKSHIKHHIPVLLASIALLLSCSCATKVNVSETLQIPEGTKLYTAYNIWKTGYWKISSINYQHGSVIPFGTEVKVISVTQRTVKLKCVPSGIPLTIRYHEKYTLQSMSEFLKKLLTTKNRQEQAKGIKPEILASILDGKVKKGMTRREVILTCGPPSPHRTPSQTNTTWIYWKSRWSTFRVIFRKDKVIEIL